MVTRFDDANILPMRASRAATVEDLYRTPGKAELVGGRLVLMPFTGCAHGQASLAIAASLRAYQRTTRRGYAFGDNVGFLVRLPGRRSFSPDAAFHSGPPTGPAFLEGAPVFAAEVRSPEDYGAIADRAYAAKRSEYFASGTRVVWDVDVLRDGWIRVYRADDPENPSEYRRGGLAEAEPALPGWTFPVDEAFID